MSIFKPRDLARVHSPQEILSYVHMVEEERFEGDVIPMSPGSSLYFEDEVDAPGHNYFVLDKPVVGSLGKVLHSGVGEVIGVLPENADDQNELTYSFQYYPKKGDKILRIDSLALPQIGGASLETLGGLAISQSLFSIVEGRSDAQRPQPQDPIDDSGLILDLNNSLQTS